MDKVIKRMQLARTGSFGADGATITLQNLQDVVDTFDGKGPVAIGHQMTRQDWWPQFGNVLTVQLETDPDGAGGTLVGDVELQGVLAEAVDSGFYPGWSVSIPPRASDGRRYLHHLAFLGATPPKIRDLLIVSGTSARPDNAIDAVGEGMAFSDQACYSFADFRQELSVAEDGSGDGGTAFPENGANGTVPETASSAEGGKSAEFSDDLARKEQKAKKAYAEGIRGRVVSEIGQRWPAGRRKELEEFADRLVEVHDYEFADDDAQPSLVQLFIDLIKGMAVNRPPVGRSHDFSDPAGGQGPANIDRAGMAQRF